MAAWWRRLASTAGTARLANISGPLQVISAGLCCSLGCELAAAGPAFMAGIDAFRAHDFLTDTGVAIPVSSIDNPTLWGHARLAKWLALAVQDCLESASRHPPAGSAYVDLKRCAMLVIAPDKETLHLQERDLPQLLGEVMATLGATFSPASKVLPVGRAGLAAALDRAYALLELGRADHVLLVAADSLLEAGLVEQFISDERVLHGGRRDGFVPGEAAAAVLMCKPLADSRATVAPLRLVGWGHAHESARWNNDIPNRAQGLTQAMRAALQHAQLQPHDLAYRVADQNGEPYYAREAGNAFARLMASPEASGLTLELVTLADKLGEIGCATGVAALSLLHYANEHPVFNPGHCGILHLSQDQGQRCAVVVLTRNLAA